MLKNISAILIWSENYRKLADDKYFATFYDLDNNLVQLIGGK